MTEIAIGTSFLGIGILIISNLKLYWYVLTHKKNSNQKEEWKKILRVKKIQGITLAGFISLIVLALVVKIMAK